MDDQTRLSQRYGRASRTRMPVPDSAAGEGRSALGSADEQTPSSPASLRLRMRSLLSTTAGKLTAAALLLAVLGIAWVTWNQTTSRVTSKDISFSFPAQGRAAVEYTVTKYPSAHVQCGIQVLDEQHAVVGWTVVDIPPNDRDAPGTEANGTTTRHVTELRTVSPGVNGGVSSCWKAD